MNRRLLYFLAMSALVASIIAGFAVMTTERGIILYEGVEGPHDRSMVSTSQRTSWAKYGGGGTSRLSILLTDTDSAWLACVARLPSGANWRPETQRVITFRRPLTFF